MSTTLAIYRLPSARSALIGNVRVVFDRNQQIYVQGSRIVHTTESGDFLILTLQNEQVYYVKTKDYDSITKVLTAPTKSSRKRPVHKK